MKVGELIVELLNLNPNLDIYVEGYEGGVNDPSISKPQWIRRDANTHIGYLGNHQNYEGWSKNKILKSIAVPEHSLTRGYILEAE